VKRLSPASVNLNDGPEKTKPARRKKSPSQQRRDKLRFVQWKQRRSAAGNPQTSDVPQPDGTVSAASPTVAELSISTAEAVRTGSPESAGQLEPANSQPVEQPIDPCPAGLSRDTGTSLYSWSNLLTRCQNRTSSWHWNQPRAASGTTC